VDIKLFFSFRTAELFGGIPCQVVEWSVKHSCRFGKISRFIIRGTIYCSSALWSSVDWAAAFYQLFKLGEYQQNRRVVLILLFASIRDAYAECFLCTLYKDVFVNIVPALQYTPRTIIFGWFLCILQSGILSSLSVEYKYTFGRPIMGKIRGTHGVRRHYMLWQPMMLRAVHILWDCGMFLPTESVMNTCWLADKWCKLHLIMLVRLV